MNQLPKTIKVGPFEYTVTEVEHLAEKHGSLGEHVPFSSEILIDSGLDWQSKKQVFFHEVLHALEERFKLEIGGENADDKIDRMATVLLQFLQDNNLIQWEK